MATPSSSVGSCVAVGEESTWGTAVARTSVMQLVGSPTFTNNLTRTVVPTMLNAGTGSYNAIDTYDALNEVGATFQVVLTYESMGLLFKHAMRKNPTTSGGSPPYTHTYLLQRAAPAGGLTLEFGIGISSTTILLAGCRVTKLTIECQTGGLVLATVEVIAKSQATSTRTSLTLSTVRATHKHGAALTFNSRSIGLRSWKLILDHKLARAYEIGSSNTLDPVAGVDLLEVTMEAEIHGLDTNGLSEYTAATASDVVVAFTNTANYGASFTLHNAILVEDPNPRVSMGSPITQTLKWRGFSDGTDEGLAIVITNTQSSATAA